MHTLLTIGLLQIVILIVPGPDVLLVSQTAIARSRRSALFAGAGVVTGIGIWAVLALLGIGVLFAHFALLHGVIKVAGGLYLLYMAFNLWRSSMGGQGGSHVAAPTPLGDWKAYRSGLLTNLANPKAAVFFGSVFSSLMPAHSSTGLRVGVFAVILGLSLLWFALVSFGMSTAPLQASYIRAKRTIDRIAGTLMAGFGTLLLASRE
ncbi:LysE family transporter [Deinococcus sp. KNUC1210]|uniref:LysE family transporter n=1 Tax=Deinococcus sp. KNUC1210 TaxID=2917691 RepID=UPI001EF0402B|nr:LysE family transporter [Deinococcus sp. KNUC1210]ULH15025.1 LysE family transporter [Deinococcus sp. KNUC1210]